MNHRHTRVLAHFCASLSLLFASFAHAAPGLVKDISPFDSYPDRFANLGGVLLFVADDGTNGVELWKSDGTAAGTSMVTDINVGGDADPGSFTGLVVHNGAVYFDADDGTNGVELWKSDGTAVGTTMVKDIRVGGNNSNPQSLAEVGSLLFFSANDGTNGSELWVTDGTGPNTALVSNINPGGNSSPHDIVDLGGVALFAADDGTNGIELWKSDGITASLVANINPLAGSSPSRLVTLAGKLYFAASDGTNGIELWTSDGTGPGTAMLKDIRPGSFSSSPGSSSGVILNQNGILYFDANDGVNGRELWKSDGTAAGTVMLKDISVGGSSSPGNTGGILNVGGTLFFDADDGISGDELWKSDGTATGTVMVSDVEAGGGGSDPGPIVNVNGTVFFNSCTTAAGCELWMSDGTAAGTSLVADLQPGFGDSDPQQLTNVGGTLFFSADDGATGVELWSVEVCTQIDALIPGCVPATSNLGKCSASLGKLSLKLLAADRKCASKNSAAAVKLDTYAGQSCEDVARYRFLGGLSSLQLKDPVCVPTCFGSGDIDSRALEIEASVDALHGAMYCDPTSGILQDDGFGGYVPAPASQSCEDGIAKLAGSLSKTLVGCNAKKATAAISSSTFDLATCQADAVARFDSSAAGLSACPACLQATAVRDSVVEQTNASDSASAYCRNSLP